MEGKIYDHNELKFYSNQELVQCLKEHWKVETDTIEVWGEIKPLKDKSFGFLTNVSTFTSNTPLIYPLKGHEYYCDFFISSSDAQKFGNRNSPRLIRCELVLAPEAERKKHNIPFELNVLPGSCTPLEQLPDT
ncbi:restriction endonuclease, partial [Pseudoalteromonas sp. MMG012]|nr:restriction endonuclease [Pseudoalteromonas sp. MMG012]